MNDKVIKLHELQKGDKFRFANNSHKFVYVFLGCDGAYGKFALPDDLDSFGNIVCWAEVEKVEGDENDKTRS